MHALQADSMRHLSHGDILEEALRTVSVSQLNVEIEEEEEEEEDAHIGSSAVGANIPLASTFRRRSVDQLVSGA